MLDLYPPPGTIAPISDCMVCRRWRDWDIIAVAERPAKVEVPPDVAARFGPFIHRVRYCIDEPQCVAVALEPGPWPGWGGR